MVLSNRQKDDLHRAILGYVKANYASSSDSTPPSFNDMFNNLAATLSIDTNTLDAQYDDLLEKKWTSLIRLQKKIIELEEKNRELTEELSNKSTLHANGASSFFQSHNSSKLSNLSTVLPTDTPQHRLAGHRDAITSVHFHPIYTLLISTSEDCTMKLWDYETGQFERTVAGHTGAVTDCCFNTRGDLLASSSVDQTIKIWSFTDEVRCIRSLVGHEHTVSSVKFLETSEHLISCSRDQSMRVWEVATGYCVRTLHGHDAWVRTMALAVLPSTLVASLEGNSNDRSSITSTTTQNGNMSSSNMNGGTNKPGSTLGTLLDGKLTYVLASASNDQTIRIWNLRTFECISILRDHSHVVECIAFSNAASDTYIHEWREEEKTMGVPLIKPLSLSTRKAGSGDDEAEIHPSTLASLGGLYLLSGSRDKSIKLWELASGLCIRTFETHDNWVRNVLFHPAGRYFLSCSDDKSIRAWDFKRNGKVVKKIENAHPLFVSCMEWNKKFPLLASGAVDNSIHIWECR